MSRFGDDAIAEAARKTRYVAGQANREWTFCVTNVQCTGDGARADGSSARDFGSRTVLTAFVLIGGRGTGIAIAAASGPSSSGAAR